MRESEQSGSLYARELEQILAEHGLQLADLVDRAGLEAATVERLHLALTDSLLLPVLSPQEQELLVTGLLLTADEQRRLLAALLGTAIQRLLQDQLGLAWAQQVSAQIYPCLLTASSQADLDTLGVPERTPDHGSREDQTWQAIWGALDSAALAWQTSNGRGLSRRERLRHLQTARAWLEEALADLAGLRTAGQTSPVWRTCQSRASQDLKAVNRSLRHLESGQ
jgi:hypothetical protein